MFAEIEGRPIVGPASEQITGAREGLWLMRNRPEEAFRCGPLAIDQILASTRANYRRGERIWRSKSTAKGTSLAQMRQLAADLDLPMQMAYRSPGADVLLPALVHWRAGHFAAVIREENGRYLVRDPTFGDEIWISKTALDDEATGYVLIAPQALPASWRAVDDREGAEIWGKGQTDSNNPDETCEDCSLKSDDCPSGGLCQGGHGGSGSGGGGGGGGGPRNPQPIGMARYSAHLMLVSLNLRDMPVGYRPPRGPAMFFGVTYNQREAFQPQTFSFSHLGPKWMANWLSYLEDDPTNPSAMAYLAMRGGGRERYQNFNAGTPQYEPGRMTQAVLVRTSTSPVRYERRLKDGSIEVFAQPDGAVTLPRRIFLTELRDAAGNSVTLTYDSQLRLVSLTDAIGQVTTLLYDDPADSRRITRVTDPFGRFATFAYDGNGRLASITDTIGLQSSFTYDNADFITTLTTPYGVSRFSKGEDGRDRWLEMVDPVGARERIEYRNTTLSPTSEPTSVVPVGSGLSFTNAYLEYRNTFYWNKRAMAVAPRDPASAHIMHWLHTDGPLNQTSGVLESEKLPLERRVWYLYPGQPNSIVEGTLRRPSVAARVLDDGASQIWRATYTSLGRVTSQTDPQGRRVSYVYAVNGIDLSEVRQTTGMLNELLASYSNYTPQHVPQTVTDAANQSSTVTYNAQGQALTFTNAKNEVTTFTYDTNGYLQTVTGAVPGATTSYTYDGYGRVRTVTEVDGYVRTFDYDGMNRPTRVTFPDGSYDETTYDRLDPVEYRDRLGRTTKLFYDAMRRIIAVRDPAGVTTTQRWCGCGGLEAFVDGNGQETLWDFDVQGRVTRETRAAELAVTSYTYETTTSRMKTERNAKGEDMVFTYHVDDTLQSVAFPNAIIATPTVSYTYDPDYSRLVTMLDGTGTTTYAYKSLGTPGALRLGSVDGPLSNDVVSYDYDELGRIVTRAINGVANQTTYTFDALDRIATETTLLGTFTFSYDGVSERVASVTYPNAQSSTLAYYGTTADNRLQTIHNKYVGGATMSKFDFTYDRVGNLETWRQQADNAAPVDWRYGYDGDNQILTVSVHSTDPTPQLLKRFAYTYDAAGNRRSEQIDDAVTSSSYNTLNRLVSQQPGGAIRVAGAVNEPAAVTINGTPAATTASNAFAGQAPVSAGTSTFTVSATDSSGNSVSKQFEVDTAGPSHAFTYDANGSLASDGTRTFEWDARNQLRATTVGTHRTEFTYDGHQRRVRIVEKENGVTQSETAVVWCGSEICEERAADGVTVKRRAFALGEEVNGNVRFFALDHLGSVREVTSATGTVLARYAYDPWGRRELVTGTDVTTIGFTGLQWQSTAASWLPQHRAYDPNLGRWLSEEPLGLEESTNLYTYVDNEVTTAVDPTGLAKRKRQGIRQKPARCTKDEWAYCRQFCGTRAVLSCSVQKISRITRVVAQGYTVYTTNRRTPDCNCDDPDDDGPSDCKDCVKTPVLIVIAGLIASILWVCLTRTPPPVPA